MDSYRLARPLLFALDAERAHSWGLSLLRFTSKVNVAPTPLRTALGELANPVGMPAGYDKTGRHLRDLARLGFGYIMAGTFTRSAWPGNPKPRVARDVKERTLTNALGFPNPGIDEFIRNLSAAETVGPPVVASISGKTIEDVMACYIKVQRHVAGVELNLSSPNTPDLRDLRELPTFSELAQSMKQAKEKPTYLKIPPYLEDDQFSSIMDLVKRWEELGFEGVTASNSIPVDDARMSVGKGGLSGPPLLGHTKTAVEVIRKAVAASFEVNAVGGISNPADATTLLKSGATTVQVFTAMVYEGPSLIKRMLLDPEIQSLMEGRRAAKG